MSQFVTALRKPTKNLSREGARRTVSPHVTGFVAFCICIRLQFRNLAGRLLLGRRNANEDCDRDFRVLKAVGTFILFSQIVQCVLRGSASLAAVE